MDKLTWDVDALGVWSVATRYADKDTLTALGIVSLVLVLDAIITAMSARKANRIQWNKKQGMTMARGDRKNYVRIKVADVITDGFEDLVYKQVISRQEAQAEYGKLGRYLDNAELIPVKFTPEAVRGRLLSKLAFWNSTKAVTKPVIPGPKPGEAVTLPSNIVSFGQAAIARRQKAA